MTIARELKTTFRLRASSLTVPLFVVASACTGPPATTNSGGAVTLRIGLGLAAGPAPSARVVARSAALESLISIQRDGRPAPRLAESWSVSDDGRTLRMRVPSQLKFPSGRPADAHVIQTILQAKAPAALGPAFGDIVEIRATSDRDIEIVLRQPSRFALEALEGLWIEDPAAPLSGTGPFYVPPDEVEHPGRDSDLEMHVNQHFHGGRPAIERVLIKSYTSLRSAWADMLRGQVDMLYDVGADALASLESSSQVKIFPYQRGYTFLVLLNLRKIEFSDMRLRRALNAAIDRNALVADVFKGHGTPAAAAIWPQHWAFGAELPQFRYEPRSVEGGSPRRRLKCLFGDPSFERLALVLQRQLQSVGFDLDLELVSARDIGARLESGDFDAVLSDFPVGPHLVRANLLWHSRGPLNFGHYSNATVDLALESIDHATDDAAYKAGVAAFERAIVDDPPAIFLAWGQRARAISNRFEVPADPDAALRTVHLWRPAGSERVARRN